VNIPLEVGATDDDYRLVYDQVVLPVLSQFEPDIVLVSAGFDAHERDPLGGARLSTAAFTAMTAALRAVADRCCDGRLVAVTEGGYDLRALGDCLRVVIDVLAGEATAEVCWPEAPVASSRGRAAATQTKAALTQYWKF
jgi:acetoin utilization deacetylase AcuC-like enzyme